MARDGMGSVIGIAAVAGLAYWAYSSGLLSSLMGSSPTTAATGGGNPASGAGTTPVVNSTPPAPPPACGPSGALAKILALAQKANPTMKLGPNGTDTFTIDQWGYYGDQYCTGLPAQSGWNADTLFPGDANRGGPLNWNAAAGFGVQRGLSAVRRGRRVIGTHPVRRVA